MEEKNLNKVIEEKDEIRKLKDEEELNDKLIQKFYIIVIYRRIL